MKTSKLLVIGAVLVLGALSGCKEEHSVDTLPGIQAAIDSTDDLKGCKVIVLQSNFGGRIDVVRCPNSDTTATYKRGKRRYSTTVMDSNH